MPISAAAVRAAPVRAIAKIAMTTSSASTTADVQRGKTSDPVVGSKLGIYLSIYRGAVADRPVIAANLGVGPDPAAVARDASRGAVCRSLLQRANGWCRRMPAAPRHPMAQGRGRTKVSQGAFCHPAALTSALEPGTLAG